MSGATTPREGYYALREGRVLCIAHRGARSVAPENTILAAQRGLEEGADLWELDVQLTADGHLVVVHDDTLDRGLHPFPCRGNRRSGSPRARSVRRLPRPAPGRHGPRRGFEHPQKFFHRSWDVTHVVEGGVAYHHVK